MPTRVTCPNCRTAFTAPDALSGKTVTCPRCAAPIHIGAVTPNPPLAAVYTPLAEAAPVAFAQPAGKECPFCGETVLAAAKKCKHCGEIIDVALRAAEDAAREAREARRAAERPTMPIFNNVVGSAAASSSSSAAASSGSRRGPRPVVFSPCAGCLSLMGTGLIVLVIVAALINSQPVASPTAAPPKKPTPNAPSAPDAARVPVEAVLPSPTAHDEAAAVEGVLAARDLLVHGRKREGIAKLNVVTTKYPGTRGAREAQAWLDGLKQ